jgi:uncharacterized protein YmfQ (DUF2313 family)
MTLEETTQLYASVLRQLLPTGGYDTSPNTEALAVDVYAHAKLLAQADLDAKHLLKVLEGFPPELINKYETEYDLPLKCTVNAGKTLEERIDLLKWVRSTRNVLNKAYLEQILAFFGVELFELRKYTPMQCTAPCNAPVNTEQLRYKIRIVIPDTAPADMDCIIQNYFPGYLRIDVLKVPLLFKTSKPYPFFFTESLQTDFELAGDVEQRVVMNEGFLDIESVDTAFAITSAMQRDIMNESFLDIESIDTAFAITSAMQLDILNSTTIDSEKVSTALALTAATQKEALISTVMSAESVSTSFALTAAQFID